MQQKKPKHMPSSQLFPKWGSLTAGTEAAAAQAMIGKKGGTKWPSTHQSVNSGSLFHPQEENKAFRSSTGDLEPLLRHEGHGDQLSFGGGGPAGAEGWETFSRECAASHQRHVWRQ